MLPQLQFKIMASWPRLAWVAKMNLETNMVEVYHGAAVETNTQWCGEIVWDLPFGKGDFDLTDTTIGTGIRVRDDRVVFVSSSDTLNRLQYVRVEHTLIVSNSTPALLALANLNMCDGFDYHGAMNSICKGIDFALLDLPTRTIPFRIVYFYNIDVRDGNLKEVLKPETHRDVSCYKKYYNFLKGHAEKIMTNASAPARQHKVKGLTSCSTGYDSPAVSLLAYGAGITDAVTISNSRMEPGRILDTNDSGADLAKQIGLNCKSFKRKQINYPLEDAIWSVLGNVGDVNLTVFDYPGQVCLFWVGFGAGKIWAEASAEKPFLSRGYPHDTSGLRFCEARLELGVLLCSPPFWATFQRDQIKALHSAKEMHPWRVDSDYDRPIQRRMLEDYGIQRGAFGTSKKASSFNRMHGAPLSANLRSSFYAFQENRGRKKVTRFFEYLSLWLRAMDSILLQKLPKTVRFSCRNWIQLPKPNEFLLWSMERRMKRYTLDSSQD